MTTTRAKAIGNKTLRISRSKVPSRDQIPCYVEHASFNNYGKSINTRYFHSQTKLMIPNDPEAERRMSLMGIQSADDEQTFFQVSKEDNVITYAYLGSVSDFNQDFADNLRAQGFWTSDKISAFMEEGKIPIRDDQVEKLVSLVEMGLLKMKPDEAMEFAKANDVYFNWRDLPAPSDESGSGDMTFDHDRIAANVAAWFLATRERAKSATENARLKRENCTTCVYDCQRRWRLRDGSCTLTEQDVISQYPNTDRARRWMALFALGDIRVGAGRSQKIIFGPASTDIDSNGGTMLLRSLSPPYKVKVGKFWINEDHEEYGAAFTRALACITEASVEHQARLFFALQNMHKHCNISAARPWGRSQFIKGAEGKKGRLSQNDALSMSIKVYGDPDGWRIYIKTDTRASYPRDAFYPGMSKCDMPDRISKDERPRFETSYRMPFFGDMMSWTAKPIGAQLRRRGELPIVEDV